MIQKYKDVVSLIRTYSQADDQANPASSTQMPLSKTEENQAASGSRRVKGWKMPQKEGAYQIVKPELLPLITTI